MSDTKLEKFFNQRGLSDHGWIGPQSAAVSEVEIYHTPIALANDSHIVAVVLKHYVRSGTVKAYVGAIHCDDIAGSAHEMAKMNYNKAISVNGAESISKMSARIGEAIIKFGGEKNART
jgi:hypothetical protein